MVTERSDKTQEQQPTLPLVGANETERPADSAHLNRRGTFEVDAPPGLLDRLNPCVLHVPTFLKGYRGMLKAENFSWRLLAASVVAHGAVSGVSVPVRLGQALDHVLFPGFRKQAVEAPVYILAPPRSGTTFLHRLLAMDEAQFTDIKLWQSLSPNLLTYFAMGKLSATDGALGGPLRKLVDSINRALFSGWDGIHAVGFDRNEEDELLFIYPGLSTAWMLLWPFINRAEPAVVTTDDLPRGARYRLARYYRAFQKRHLYATGPQKTLLAKNALAAGRIGILHEAAPDMRVVHIVRHPYESIASTCSMFMKPVRAHSRRPEQDAIYSKDWAQAGITFYKRMLTACQTLPADQVFEVRYEELITHPRATVERIYETFGLPMSEDYHERLIKETERARAYKSVHKYGLEDFGLTKDDVYEAMPEVFEAYGFER